MLGAHQDKHPGSLRIKGAWSVLDGMTNNSDYFFIGRRLAFSDRIICSAIFHCFPYGFIHLPYSLQIFVTMLRMSQFYDFIIEIVYAKCNIIREIFSFFDSLGAAESKKKASSLSSSRLFPAGWSRCLGTVFRADSSDGKIIRAETR